MHKMSRWLNSLIILFVMLQDCTFSLRLLEVHIPNYVVAGTNTELQCRYDLDDEALYSVKWYKDGNEFYRYLPRELPPAHTYMLPGVTVDVTNSNDTTVKLLDVSQHSQGRFRCEVSGEAPAFQTVTEHADMVVATLPERGQTKISGARPRYQPGDWLSVNCTGGRSRPAVELSWYVNGEPAEPRMLRKYEVLVHSADGRQTVILGLQFRVEQQHFRHGDMKLKCVASLSDLYWRSIEASIVPDRPYKAPALESRETFHSRADPMQASPAASLAARSLLLLCAAAALAGLIAS